MRLCKRSLDLKTKETEFLLTHNTMTPSIQNHLYMALIRITSIHALSSLYDVCVKIEQEYSVCKVGLGIYRR